MANGHVEIHDPFLNNNNLTGCTDPESTSDTDSMGDTVEFRLLMAYAQRRRPKKESSTPNLVNGDTHVKGPSSPQTPAKTEKEEEEEKKKKKKKKKKRKNPWKSVQNIFKCIKPQTAGEELTQNEENTHDDGNRCLVPGGEVTIKEVDELDEAASILTEIASEIPFIPPPPPELETDSPEDENMEKMIGLILRDVGDEVDSREKIDAAVIKAIFWNYSFFEKLIKTLLMRMGLMTDPEAPGPQASPQAHIAVTCEVTSRLSAGETLPMSRMLNYGARYLKDHYSSWVQQQGGYVEAFHSDDEDEVQ